MPNMGFRILDYSTRHPVGVDGGSRPLVLVPRRPNTLLPPVELPYSSLRLRELRNFFSVFRNTAGDAVVPDVPAGTYDVRIFAEGYVPVSAAYASPMASPVDVIMHRDASFHFHAEDTLFRGEVVTAAGAPHTGFPAELIDPEPLVPNHLVPINERGQFVIYAPEKTTTGPADIRIYHGTGSAVVSFASVLLNRTNTAPPTTVP